MINLDERPEKYNNTLRELRPYGIEPYRFSAYNGWKELNINTINKLGVKFKPGMSGGLNATRFVSNKQGDLKSVYEPLTHYNKVYFFARATPGVIGCVMSHLSILKHAYDQKYNVIWVMEDDIEVIKNPHLISALVVELNKLVGEQGWDILFTDYDFRDATGNYVPSRGYAPRPNKKPKNPSDGQLDKKINQHFRRVGGRFGTHSMVINKSGIKKLLNFVEKHQIFLPWDLELNSPDNMKLYTVLDDIVSNYPNRISDIKKPRYEIK